MLLICRYMVNFLIFFFSLILLFLGIDFLQKRVITSVSWSRKATHIASGIIILLFPSYLTMWQIVAMSVLFVVILSVSKVKRILSLHKINRVSWGEVYYPASVGIISLICLPDFTKAFYAGILCLALSDAIAAIIGGIIPLKTFYFGKHTKSLGGVLGFFLVTLAIFLILFMPFGSSIFLLLGIAVVLTVAEVFSFYGTDNLVVPILAALLSVFLLY